MSNFEHMKRKCAQVKVIEIDLTLCHWFENQNIKIKHALETCTNMHVEQLAKLDTIALRMDFSKWVHTRAKNVSFGPWMAAPLWMS